MSKIQAGHGSGGKLMNDMISDTIKEILGHDSIQLDDSAVLDIPSGKIAFTTDSFVITPIFFSGGNIGSLAVNGTVNDLAVMGARPAYLSCALILEEGLEMEEFKSVLRSMREAADAAGVRIVTGDTKVVPHGRGDRIYINTTGIGIIENRVQRRPIKTGNKIIINGTVGDHGVAVMAERNQLTFSRGLSSDCASLNHMIAGVTEKFPEAIAFMRDATRGGLASVLNEIVAGTKLSARLMEAHVPVKDEVTGMCDILGLDPLYVANEGKVVFIVEKESAAGILEALKKDPHGKDAAIIGEITEEFPGKAYIQTEIGGRRMLPLQLEEQLPRIC
jgi:hydrogenase expression/formation protein HypE